jgi:thiol-disulfide isomerase/thioredoxin
MFRRLACLVALFLFVASAQAADAPRYKLPIGRVLHYSGEGTSREKDAKVAASTSKSTWRITVLAWNPDDSMRVLVRSTSSYSHQGGEPHERVASAVIDLFPDGSYRLDRSLAMTLAPEQVFPQLPTDANVAAKQWQSEVDWTGNRFTFTPQSPQPANEFVFTGVQDGPVNRIYVMTQKSTFHFDPTKGIITSVESEHAQDYGFHTRGTGTLKLDKEQTLPADQAAALASDYDTYTKAAKSYASQMKGLDKQPDKAKQIMDNARLALANAEKSVNHPDVKQEFKTKLLEHDQYAQYSVGQAKRLAEVLNKPAADWSSKDLNDNPVSAQSLRGKVVVMDFWYRGCGWCMYAMPQVKRLSTHFKDKPVAVLGMNTDRNLEDARFVVKELALDYPQVQATGIPEKFGVQGFPTLIIIDQQGAVRDVHVGYSPDLFDSVSKKIEELLQSKAAG